MVRQLREVLNRHSTNDHLDAEEEMMNAIQSQEQQQKKNKKKSKYKKSTKPSITNIWDENTDYEDNYEEEGEEDDESQQENDKVKPSFYFSYASSSSSKKKKQYGFDMGKRTFQDFLKMIQEEKNLLDLKRVRNDIVTQIRKKKAQMGKIHETNA